MSAPEVHLRIARLVVEGAAAAPAHAAAPKLGTDIAAALDRRIAGADNPMPQDMADRIAAAVLARLRTAQVLP